MQLEYDKDNTPCIEYYQMLEYLGLEPDEYHEIYKECEKRATDLLFRYSADLTEYTGYDPDAED